MARFSANENFPFPTVEALRCLGHDVLTTTESGRAGQAVPDADVLAFAVAAQRIVITLNRRRQRRSHTWTGFSALRRHFRVERPRLVGRPKTRMAALDA